MNDLRKFSTVCRFCLSKEHEQFVTISEILSSSLTAELIGLFTGIELETAETVPYVVCGNCKDILNQSVQFRNICVSNDVLFKELFSQCTIPSSNSNDETEARSKQKDTGLIEIEIMYLKEASKERNGLSQDLTEVFLNDSEGREDQFDEAVISDEANEKRNKNERLSASPTTCTTATAVVSSKIQNEGSGSTKFKKQLCVTCGKLVRNLSHHVRIHTNEPTLYACPHCSTKMRNQSNLARHIQAVHLKKIVKSCEPCGRGFAHINSYNAHMRSRHGMGEPYKCEICSKTFRQPSGYKKHLSSTHTSERNFPCAICGKPFKDKQALKLHESVHSTDRPYSCAMCPKQFKSLSARRTHELTHVGVVFPCSLCDKSYQYKSLLTGFPMIYWLVPIHFWWVPIFFWCALTIFWSFPRIFWSNCIDIQSENTNKLWERTKNLWDTLKKSWERTKKSWKLTNKSWETL